jgi:hypothetical protein
LKAGDKNTSFFHRQSKARLWSNQIFEIKNLEGKNIKEFDQIKEQTFNHFLKLYTSNRRSEEALVDSLLSHIQSKILNEDNLKLNRQIEKAEILKEINRFNEDKSLGPDGFTLHFHKKMLAHNQAGFHQNDKIRA